MKRITKVVSGFCCVLCVLLLGGAGLAADSERIEIVDTVYEWAPDGDYLQVGDYIITNVGNKVWLGKQAEEKVRVDKNRIQPGNIIKAVLSGKNEDGFWLAESITILSEQTVDSSSEEENAGNTREVEEHDKASSQSRGREMYLEDGVWKN